MTKPEPPRGPSRPRLALLMLIAVYPLITAVLYAVAPLTEGWEIWQRSLLIAPIMVGAIVFAIAPMINRRFAAFLARQPSAPR